MSTLYLRGGIYYVGVPTHPNGWVKRTTETRNRPSALSMARMMDELGPRGRREWVFLDALKSRTLSVARLYDAFSTGQLDTLKGEINDVDVQPYIAEWLKSMDDQVALDTLQHYGTHVRSFIPAYGRFPISRLSRAELVKWLNSRECGPSTKRKYRAAMSSFCEYLISQELLPVNPMLQVKAPRASPPRMRYLEHSEVVRLVEAQEEPFRTISALMHATGMEISAILRLTRGDFDMDTWMVRAHGAKTSARDRQAYVMAWVRPYLLRQINSLLPSAQLFPDITRWAPTKSHTRACKELGIPNYTLRDSRHTFAVNAAKTGVPAELIAAQLGHSDTQMVNRVYARYEPARAEMAKWFDRANERTSASGSA
jgi:integrase